MNILDQKAPGLSKQLSILSSDQRRRVVAKVCKIVSESVSELEPRLKALIQLAADTNVLSTDQVKELRLYAENADKRYFSLQEEGVDKRVWKIWFAKARLATALADGFVSEDWEATAQAVYETCFIEDTEESAINLVRLEIERLNTR